MAAPSALTMAEGHFRRRLPWDSCRRTQDLLERTRRFAMPADVVGADDRQPTGPSSLVTGSVESGAAPATRRIVRLMGNALGSNSGRPRGCCESFELGDEAPGGAFGVKAAEVVAAGFAVELAGL
jgi:hypothetical protein